MPEPPADPLDGFRELIALVEILFCHSRPASGRLRNILNTHRKMKPIKDMTGRSRDRCFAQKTLPVVFSDKPVDSGNPLLTPHNVVLSPHAAAYTDGSRRRVALTVAEGI